MIPIAGKVFGVIAIFFSAFNVLSDVVVVIASAIMPIFPNLWFYTYPLSLLFAGLSGFCKNTILSMIAVITSIFYPLAALFLGLPTGGSTVSFMFMMIFSPYVIFYLFAISGVVSSVVKNRKD